jgi:hypothetical protein
MSKYLNVCGDYKLTVTDGGEIRLDPGVSGNVRVVGNLIVDGSTTTINSNELVVDDPFITINQGNVSGGQIVDDVAGIQIDRGGSDAFWVFDEGIVTEAPGAGAFVGRIGNAQTGAIVGIRTTSIDTGGTDLYLINQGTGVVTVQGTNDYEKQIFEYTTDPVDPTNDIVDFAANPIIKAGYTDALINAQALEDYVEGFFIGKYQPRIQKDDSYVAVHDTDLGDSVSAIEFTIDNNPAAYFFNDRTELQHIRIQDTKIETTSSGTDLILSSPGVGSVQINDVLYIPEGPYQDDDGVAGGTFAFGEDTDELNPDPPADGVKLFSRQEGVAGSSLYFVNGYGSQDELVSKKKALLFSMIF